MIESAVVKFCQCQMTLLSNFINLWTHQFLREIIYSLVDCYLSLKLSMQQKDNEHHGDYCLALYLF